MGLGCPLVSDADMRNFELCQAIRSVGKNIRTGLIISAVETVKGQKEIASENRKANAANTKMTLDAILNGSSYVERGLLQIASELRYSNVLTERRDLESKIRSIEDWLFDKGFLKDFYQTAELDEKIVPIANESYIYFLEKICQLELSEDEKRELQKGCSAEEFEKKLKAPKNELLRYSMNMLCHPLVALAYLISEKGLQHHCSTFYIAGERYKWGLYGDEYNEKRVSGERGLETHYDFGEYEIVFKRDKYDIIMAEPTVEEALRFLTHVATQSLNQSCKSLEVKLEWESFFAELNMHIAMYNLRVLAQSLEAFKRQKQLEMLE